jgi:antitoxin YefM
MRTINYKIPLYQEKIMPTLTTTEARSKLYRLIDEVASSHEPIIIKGRRGNAVLISEDDWRSIQETIFLLNIPGMRESIREGLATPVEKCTQELDW